MPRQGGTLCDTPSLRGEFQWAQRPDIVEPSPARVRLPRVQRNNFDAWPVEHRPWPLPQAPWVMYQEWHGLLFAHWAVPVAAMRPLVPPCFPLDLHSGQAWIGITPFRVAEARPRLLPAVPGVSSFLELNVRTYVTVDGKPGVFFFSLDAASTAAVTAARALFHLPYYTADMSVVSDGAWLHYASTRTDDEGPPAELRAAYRPTGDPFQAEQGTLEHFLAERYCLYTVDAAGNPCRCEIHHAPWLLQLAEALIERNTMANAAGLLLPGRAALLHYADVQPTIVWAPEPLISPR